MLLISEVMIANPQIEGFPLGQYMKKRTLPK